MKMLKTFSVLGLSLFSLSVLAADWQVDNAQSLLSFVSVKKANVAEVHHFETLSGQLSDNGEFSLDIALASVNTGIEIRDNRMREFLFDVVSFPSATLSAMLETSIIDQLTVGESVTETVSADLTLHGQKQPLSIAVVLTKLSADKLMVVSAQPLVLNVSDFELANGVEKLRELAGLPSISQAVPVTFYLTLNAM